MEGIENLKKLVIASLDLYKEASGAYSDKKISLWESIKLVPNLFDLISAGKSINEVVAEINDGITPEENADLEKTIAERFNIPNQKVTVFVRHALSHVIATAGLIYEFKHIHDPEEQVTGGIETPPQPPIKP